MPLIQCPGCGSQVSDQVGRCPRCNEPIDPKAVARKRRFHRALAGCLVVIAFAVAAGFVVRWLSEPSKALPLLDVVPKGLKLPPYRIVTVGHKRCNVRMVVPRGVLSMAGMKFYAVMIARTHGAEGDDFNVMAFDSKSCLDDWDGIANFLHGDYPHWICDMSLQRNKAGDLYVSNFDLATDPVTNVPRRDVLGTHDRLPDEKSAR